MQSFKQILEAPRTPVTSHLGDIPYPKSLGSLVDTAQTIAQAMAKHIQGNGLIKALCMIYLVKVFICTPSNCNRYMKLKLLTQTKGWITVQCFNSFL